MDNIESSKSMLLLIVLNEITTEHLKKLNAIEKLPPGGGGGGLEPCSFWDSYYMVGAGVSESTSEANLAGQLTGEHEFSNCTKIGGVDTSCMFDSHACVSTQAFCCD